MPPKSKASSKHEVMVEKIRADMIDVMESLNTSWNIADGLIARCQTIINRLIEHVHDGDEEEEKASKEDKSDTDSDDEPVEIHMVYCCAEGCETFAKSTESLAFKIPHAWFCSTHTWANPEAYAIRELDNLFKQLQINEVPDIYLHLSPDDDEDLHGRHLRETLCLVILIAASVRRSYTEVLHTISKEVGHVHAFMVHFSNPAKPIARFNRAAMEMSANILPNGSYTFIYDVNNLKQQLDKIPVQFEQGVRMLELRVVLKMIDAPMYEIYEDMWEKPYAGKQNQTDLDVDQDDDEDDLHDNADIQTLSGEDLAWIEGAQPLDYMSQDSGNHLRLASTFATLLIDAQEKINEYDGSIQLLSTLIKFERQVKNVYGNNTQLRQLLNTLEVDPALRNLRDLLLLTLAEQHNLRLHHPDPKQLIVSVCQGERIHTRFLLPARQYIVENILT